MSTSPTVTPEPLSSFDFSLRTRALFENGALARVGELAMALGFRRTLLVADQGLAATSHVTGAFEHLRAAGIEVTLFHDFGVNPDTRMVEAGRIVATEARVDSLVALGGGSSLDCAKGINFVLSGGGTMRDYWGFGRRGGIRFHPFVILHSISDPVLIEGLGRRSYNKLYQIVACIYH